MMYFLPRGMPAAPIASDVAAIGTSPSVLNRIAIAGTQLALWRRARPAGLSWIDDLDFDAIDDLRFAVPIADLDDAVIAGLADAGYPEDGRGTALRNEIIGLARLFATIDRVPLVALRLEIIDGDACRKFHADYVTARLLVTLAGPGTQWIEARRPTIVHQVETGDVAIFKGRLWEQESAILHRSPPIAGTGETRLLLAIQTFAIRRRNASTARAAGPSRTRRRERRRHRAAARELRRPGVRGRLRRWDAALRSDGAGSR